MARYLIPKPITRGYELFPGWNWTQVGLAVAGLVLGGALFFGAGLVGLPWPLRVVAFLLPGGLGVGLAIPPPNEPPLYRRLTAAWHYYRQPQRWVYDWRRGDWDDVNIFTIVNGAPLTEGSGARRVYGTSGGMPMPTWRPRILAKGPRNAKTQPTAAQLAAQAWLPIRDLRDGCLVRPDGAVVAGVKIAPFSLALKSDRERATAIQGFQAALNGLTVPWQIVSVYRPVDLDAYLGHLDRLHAEAAGPRRQALGEYARWVRGLVQAGETVERRYYLLLVGQGKDAVAEHRTAIRGLLDDLGRIRGFRADALSDADWRELLFLLFHASEAAVEAVPDGFPRPTPIYRKGKEGVTDGEG
ncbi:MAG: hypothetical protein K6U14_05310 [Firmicutes bacterium]|nr:hypothetical protein [Alicyclobacillaceae bacterium]MCL6497037.1 hypothetical protein [Bacillota bacterium]